MSPGKLKATADGGHHFELFKYFGFTQRGWLGEASSKKQEIKYIFKMYLETVDDK